MSTNPASKWTLAGLVRILFVVFIIAFLVAASSFVSGELAYAGMPGSILEGPETISSNAEESLGVYVDHYQSDAAQARVKMKDAGAIWTLVVIAWKNVESTDGAPYNWAYYDDMIASIVANGFSGDKIIIELAQYPDWSLAPNGHSCGPVHPDYFDDFADFATAAVNRYFTNYGITHYELGNEPDNQDPVNYGWLGGCWGNGPDQTADPTYAGGDDYADFVRAAYTPMKSVDSSIKVFIGGLAYDNWYNITGGPFDPDFVDDFLGNNGGDYTDYINYHYFKDFAYVWGSIAGKGEYLQKEFKKYGYDKPLLVTEFSVPSKHETQTLSANPHTPTIPPDNASSPLVSADGSYWGNLSATLAVNSPKALNYSTDDQANFVIIAFTRGMAYPIYPMLWFQAVDRPDKTNGYYYGLMDSSLNAKPSYTAYDVLATELTGLAFHTTISYPAPPASYAEGYEFTGGGETRWVVWVNPDSNGDVTPEDHGFDVGTGNALRVVQKDGSEQIIVDGSADDRDGTEDGTVTITLTESPQILEPLVCDAVAAITDLASTIPTDPTDVELQWQDISAAKDYDIWRDDVDPYFVPDTSTRGGTYYYDTDTDGSPYVDDGAISYPPRHQHFYVVTGRNICLQAGDLSNRVGAFQFDLVPGTP